MIRALIATCTVLSALCGVQWMTLRQLKGDLAVVNYAAAAGEFDGRREEVERVVAWLDEDARAAGGAAICANGATNAAAVRETLFGVYVYLRSRAAGVSETEARQRVADSRDQRAHAR